MRQSYDYMLDPPDDDFCEDCGESFDYCECHGEPDFEPDDYVSDFDADMAADRYFGDY